MLRVGQRLWRSGRQRSLDSPTLTITAVAAGLGLTTVATVAGVTLLTGTASNHDAGGAHFRSAALLKLPGRLGRDVWTAAGMLFVCVDVIPRCGFLSCSHTFGHIVACSTPAITADYLYALRDVEPGSEAYEERLAACHDRGAQRLLQLCFSNGGIYIKLGQHIAMLDHLLPASYVSTMKHNLLDKCPVSSWKSVARTIREDLGCEWDEMFEHIERIPVASASLAQVHKARERGTGRMLAVKVQHEDLRETSSVDLMAIEALVSLVRWVAPSADYRWLTREANENLPRELDFRIEAENSILCKRMVDASKALRGRVDVPEVDLSRTSARVLVMEWIDGVSVSDKAGLKALGCNPKGLANAIATCFCEMIYRWGFVHADPHIANMLVRKSPGGGRWQLVLLDHGLYRRLDDSFRLEYSKLWKALILGDVAGVTASATRMNAAGSVPLFAGMLTQRQWRDVTKWEKGTNRLKHDRTEREKEEIQEFVGQHAREISGLLAKVPRELLLLLKTNDCLRSVDKELGAGYNSFLVTARECVRTINAESLAQRPGWRSRVKGVVERANLEARLQAMSLYSFFFS